MNQQRKLENQIDFKKLIYLTPQMKFDDVYGPIDEWIMCFGDTQLLLEPISSSWLFFDKFHDTWERTGFRAGEVFFFLENDELALRPNPEPTIWTQDRRFDLVEDLHFSYSRMLAGGFIDQEAFSEKMCWLEIKDRRGNLWKLRETDHVWVTWNRADWVKATPPREYLPSEGVGIWQKFAEVKRRFFELWGQAEDGLLTQQDYFNAVNQLRVQDSQGTWWQVRSTDGAWLRWSGKNWVEQQPHVV